MSAYSISEYLKTQTTTATLPRFTFQVRTVNPGIRFGLTGWTFKILSDTNQSRRWAEAMMKLIPKIANIMTLRGMCPDPSTGPARPIVAAFLLALAIGYTGLYRVGPSCLEWTGSLAWKQEGSAEIRARSPLLRLLGAL
jgi:hypothetical protein